MTDEPSFIQRVYTHNRARAKSNQRDIWIRNMKLLGYEIEEKNGYTVARKPE